MKRRALETPLQRGNSKLPQPPHDTKLNELAKPLQAWWAKHGERLRLVDPWLAELDALDRG